MTFKKAIRESLEKLADRCVQQDGKLQIAVIDDDMRHKFNRCFANAECYSDGGFCRYQKDLRQHGDRIYVECAYTKHPHRFSKMSKRVSNYGHYWEGA